jgi:hypothetical protein
MHERFRKPQSLDGLDLAASFEMSRNRLDAYGSALHSGLQVAAHSCCEVRNCLARKVRPKSNCLRLICFRYQR